MHSARRRKVGGTAVAILVVIALLATAVWLQTRIAGDDQAGAVIATAPTPTTKPPPRTTTTTQAPPPAPPSQVGEGSGGYRFRYGVARPVSLPATVADAAGGQVPLYENMGQAEAPDALRNPTREGLPLVFLVQQRVGDWLEVQVPVRPNMATAWIKAGDVTLRQVDYRIVIDVGAQRLSAFHLGEKVLDADVATGLSGTPTPTGTFYIDGIVQVEPPDGVYGPYQLSVAAFSDVLHSFGGGNGQIAIHGTNAPGAIGVPASHGCVRMNNDDITRLASMVRSGAPVEIG
jgi:lipoprotein-anchoring transpeptidase ErfK/SrfK